MIKKMTYFFAGFFVSMLICFLFINNYTDYRNDSLVRGWRNILNQDLKVVSSVYAKQSTIINFPVTSKDFFKGNVLYNKNGVILLKGGIDDKSILFFYPITNDGKLEWRCVTNINLKNMGEYICE